jgi:hypothetical protein
VAVVVLLSWQSHAWLYGGDFSKSFEECFTIREKAATNVAFTKGVYEQYIVLRMKQMYAHNNNYWRRRF